MPNLFEPISFLDMMPSWSSNIASRDERLFGFGNSSDRPTRALFVRPEWRGARADRASARTQDPLKKSGSQEMEFVTLLVTSSVHASRHALACAHEPKGSYLFERDRCRGQRPEFG